MIAFEPSVLTKPRSGVKADPLHPINRGLVAWWMFNEGDGSRVEDISGKGNHATAPNPLSTGWGGSLSGRALSFDGVDDYLAIQDSPSLILHDRFSLSVWARENTSKDGGFISDYASDVSGEPNWGFFAQNGAPTHRFCTKHPSTSCSSLTNNYTTDGSWHHYACTFPGGSANSRVLVDGGRGENELGEPSGGSTNGSIQQVEIGRYASTNYINGQIENVRIWDRVLLLAERKQLFHQPFVGIAG